MRLQEGLDTRIGRSRILVFGAHDERDARGVLQSEHPVGGQSQLEFGVADEWPVVA